MGYLTIEKKSNDEFIEKKSVFIGHIMRTETEDEAKMFIQEIKNKYKDARHNVYAYAIGENSEVQRYNDDGEPKGTGGIPVLEVIKKNNLRNVTVVVTRYFGGILLGAGGLARAYSKGAAIAVEAGGIVEKVKGVPITVYMPYDLHGKLQYVCASNEWHIEDTQYTDEVAIVIYCEKIKVDEICSEITNQTAAKARITRNDEEYFFKKESRLLK